MQNDRNAHLVPAKPGLAASPAPVAANAGPRPAPSVQSAAAPPGQAWSGRVVYPEVYYAVQPFVKQACDYWEINNVSLNQDLVDDMAEGIYHDICQFYPELADYAMCQNRGLRRTNYAAMQFGNRGFRRRGMLRDLIDILLLYELFGRRGFSGCC